MVVSWYWVEGSSGFSFDCYLIGGGLSMSFEICG